MRRIDNGDGSWTVVFDTPSEALDDCETGKYGDSEYYTKIRDEIHYYIQFIEDGLRSTQIIECIEVPVLKGHVVQYAIYDKNGQERTIGYSLRANGTAFVTYKTIKPVYRKLVPSEKGDPEGSVRYDYIYGDIRREAIFI